MWIALTSASLSQPMIIVIDRAQKSCSVHEKLLRTILQAGSDLTIGQEFTNEGDFITLTDGMKTGD
jgi:hypothetical protein